MVEVTRDELRLLRERAAAYEQLTEQLAERYIVIPKDEWDRDILPVLLDADVVGRPRD